MGGSPSLPTPRTVRLPVSDAGPVNAHGSVAPAAPNQPRPSSSTGNILTDALKKMGFAGFLGR